MHSGSDRRSPDSLPVPLPAKGPAFPSSFPEVASVTLHHQGSWFSRPTPVTVLHETTARSRPCSPYNAIRNFCTDIQKTNEGIVRDWTAHRHYNAHNLGGSRYRRYAADVHSGRVNLITTIYSICPATLSAGMLNNDVAIGLADRRLNGLRRRRKSDPRVRSTTVLAISGSSGLVRRIGDRLDEWVALEPCEMR